MSSGHKSPSGYTQSSCGLTFFWVIIATAVGNSIVAEAIAVNRSIGLLHDHDVALPSGRISDD